MAKISRLSLIVLAVVTLFVTVGRWLGYTQSPNLALLFTYPDGTPCQRPCLFGIRPGQSSYAQAVALLQFHPLTHGFSSPGMRNVFSTRFLAVIVSLDGDDRVSRITLMSATDASPVAEITTYGQMIDHLGVPTQVKAGGGQLWSYYPSAHMVFTHRGEPDHLTFHEPFVAMSVYETMPEPSSIAAPDNARQHQIILSAAAVYQTLNPQPRLRHRWQTRIKTRVFFPAQLGKRAPLSRASCLPGR